MGSIKTLSDELYDGSLNKMQMFIKKLKCRATATGWTSICKVNGKSFFEEYGKISIEEIVDSTKE